MDLPKVSLLINKQTGGGGKRKKKKEEKGEGNRSALSDLHCLICASVKILTGGILSCQRESQSNLSICMPSLVFWKAYSRVQSKRGDGGRMRVIGEVGNASI